MLEIAVFLCGAIVMIYEIVGSRVVAPYFGTSIYVWTSLIGVILASLAAGYWFGGRLADRKPRFSTLSAIILIAALLIGLTTLAKDNILMFLTQITDSLMNRSLLTALLLFAPASIFLGMVSPYAVRLKLVSLDTSGKTVGNLYAISTIGSIFGTFLTGFFLIPLLGTINILLMIGVLLVITAASLYFSFRKHPGRASTSIILFISFGFLAFSYNFSPSKPGIIIEDTRYNRVQIYQSESWETGDPIKVMKINNEYSSAIYLEKDELVYEYLRYYKLAEHFIPEFNKALMIGGAAFTYPQYFLNHYPDASIDVVEIDPALTRLARQHFGLRDDTRMKIFHEDARTFLNRMNDNYDVIFGDAFKSLLAIPFQLTSLEAVEKQYDMLADNGIMILNIVASMEGNASLFLKAEYKTVKQVFPQVYLFACHDPEDYERLQSISLVALKSPATPSFINDDPELQAYLNTTITIDIDDNTPILTDDHAPVEYYAMKAL